MLKSHIIEQISDQIGEKFRHSSWHDGRKNLKSVLTAIFAKLDLVTREEFDIQQKVLVATRKKLEDLEEELARLTKK